MTTASKVTWELSPKDKENIKMVAHCLGTGCEILAMTVGEFFPYVKTLLGFTAKLLKDPISEEMKEFTKQCEIINQKLERIEHQFKARELAQQRSSLNILNFESMAHINSQFKAFRKIFTAETGAREMMIDHFLSQFENTKKDKNLDHLYMSLIGEKREPMLDTIMVTEKWSKKGVEEFCADLKKLFVKGILALMGYTALKKGTDEEDLWNKWLDRMENIDVRIKAAVEKCVKKFPEQAKTDLDEMLKAAKTSADPEFTQLLLKTLVDKYYWVTWSVRVFMGKSDHVSPDPGNYFEHLHDNKIKIVVSFTTDPKSLDKDRITQLIMEQKGKVKSVAESLCKSLPNCLVHAIQHCDTKEEANNFDPGHFYYRFHNKTHFFIHSE